MAIRRRTWEASRSRSRPWRRWAAIWPASSGRTAFASSPCRRGIPESVPEGLDWREAITEALERETMLKRAATLDDVGNVAAFAASALARTMTATALNITCGAQVD